MNESNYILNIKNQFPIFKTKYNNNDLAYLDTAASSQLPQCVINNLNEYHLKSHANIHRGVYKLSEDSTALYEKTRYKVKQFINAKHNYECIFTKGTTESINLIASSFGEKYINKDDEIIISQMEHHSNIVPWQMLCKRKKAILKIIPINDIGELDLSNIDNLLTKKTKIIAITHISNSLGTINPVKLIIDKAHQKNIPVLLDSAQAITNININVQKLNCDFLVFSAHKMYGPTGVGVLYAKEKWLINMPPYQGGGDMITKVTLQNSTFNELPYKFEAGTPPIANVIAFGETINFLNTIDESITMEYKKKLLQYTNQELLKIKGLKIIGNSNNKIGIISFILSNIHPHDVSSIIDQYGVTIRAGHHCSMPTMDYFKVSATNRVSFGIYTTINDINQLCNALKKTLTFFEK